MKNLPLILAFLALPLVIACGDDGGGSGVDPDKAVSEVSVEEAKDICNATTGRVSSEVLRFNCVIAGLIAEAQQAGECEEVRDMCIENPDEDDTVDCDLDQSDVDELPDCASDITVGEFEACLNDQADQLDELGGTVTCETALEELEELGETEDPASCQALEEKCPGIFDVDDDADA